jgi:DNA polymerase V
MLNRHATFIGRVSGDSMELMSIFDGDLIIIDRKIQAKDGDVIVATYIQEFVCKILDYKNRRLLSASDKYKPVYIHDCNDFSFEGVVRSSVRLFRSSNGMRSKLY